MDNTALNMWFSISYVWRQFNAQSSWTPDDPSVYTNLYHSRFKPGIREDVFKENEFTPVDPYLIIGSLCCSSLNLLGSVLDEPTKRKISAITSDIVCLHCSIYCLQNTNGFIAEAIKNELRSRRHSYEHAYCESKHLVTFYDANKFTCLDSSNSSNLTKNPEREIRETEAILQKSAILRDLPVENCSLISQFCWKNNISNTFVIVNVFNHDLFS